MFYRAQIGIDRTVLRFQFRQVFVFCVIAALLLGWNTFAYGISYFVDSIAGNDAWSGDSDFQTMVVPMDRGAVCTVLLLFN